MYELAGPFLSKPPQWAREHVHGIIWPRSIRVKAGKKEGQAASVEKHLLIIPTSWGAPVGCCEPESKWNWGWGRVSSVLGGQITWRWMPLHWSRGITMNIQRSGKSGGRHAMNAVSISCPKDRAYVLAFTMSCRDDPGQVVNSQVFVSCKWNLNHFMVLICEA